MNDSLHYLMLKHLFLIFTIIFIFISIRLHIPWEITFNYTYSITIHYKFNIVFYNFIHQHRENRPIFIFISRSFWTSKIKCNNFVNRISNIDKSGKIPFLFLPCRITPDRGLSLYYITLGIVWSLKSTHNSVFPRGFSVVPRGKTFPRSEIKGCLAEMDASLEYGYL